MRTVNGFAHSFDSKAASIYELLLTARQHRHLRMSDVQSQSSQRLFTRLSCDDAIKLVHSTSANSSPVSIQLQSGFWKIVGLSTWFRRIWRWVERSHTCDGLMAWLYDACCSGARFNVYPQTHYSLWKWLEKIRCMLVEGCINSPPLYPLLLLPDELRNSDSNW